LWIYAYHSIIS